MQRNAMQCNAMQMQCAQAAGKSASSGLNRGAEAGTRVGQCRKPLSEQKQGQGRPHQSEPDVWADME
eukprot:192097-Lingulodinium_polyedra.AAC.1